jgi:uncharacterized membrane protein YczE
MGEKEEKQNEVKERRVQPSEAGEFMIGILLLAAGLFMLANKVRVSTGWYGLSFGGFNVSSGVVTIPLILGVIWHTISPKRFAPKLLIVLGTLFIVVSIIMSVRLTMLTASLFEYIVMFFLMAIGTGLIIKTVFTDPKEEK